MTYALITVGSRGVNVTRGIASLDLAEEAKSMALTGRTRAGDKAWHEAFYKRAEEWRKKVGKPNACYGEPVYSSAPFSYAEIFPEFPDSPQ